MISSAAYLARKIHRTLKDGSFRDRAQRHAASAMYTPFRVAVDYATLSRLDRRLDLHAGYTDHRLDPRALRIAPETADRVIAAYHKAIAEERQADADYQVRGLWREWLDLLYAPLIGALQAGDRSALLTLLENFERADFARGTGAGWHDWNQYRKSLYGRAYVRTVWAAYRDKALELGAAEDRIRHPMIGNPAGIFFNGSVIQTETWRHVAKAWEIAELLRGVPDAVVLEIGGGYGSQTFQTVTLADLSRYLLFDLPEVAAVSGAFLITALPDKRVVLFGESPVSAAGDFDIGVFPHFAVETIEPQSVDLVFNSNSFSEMDGASARRYLAVINVIGRRWFRHTNHEERLIFRQPDGSESINVIGSEMVPRGWRRVYKRPRIYGRPEDRPYKSYEYLYERI